MGRHRRSLVQTSGRPAPPVAGGFVPAPDLAAWAMETFVVGRGPLLNPHHAHLQNATVAMLWAMEPNERGGRQILGTAQVGQVRASDPWIRGQREQQIRDWFGTIPDFLIVIDAGYWELAEDAQACALVEHELYHCAQAQDEFGMPRFTRDGMPIWTMRPHDVEEFVGVVQRYGAAATYTEELKAAFERGPTIAAANIAACCGTCHPR